MLHEKQLRSFLVSAFEQLRAHDAKLNSLMTEIAAIRDALNEIGPKYDEILSRHRKKYMGEIGPGAEDQLRRYDAIIEQLKDS
jgi:hypothetical protein